ncbi:hypothetical protein C8R48DRAFT_720070 [Suillus tomentosus]|nr:hypothetical protein C8R48DRAFT_720070 [Suillus tomentosus]
MGSSRITGRKVPWCTWKEILLRIYTLRHILKVLLESTIAGEHGKDDRSKFWAKSKKISNAYDDDFLNRAQGDIFVILTFVRSFLYQ